MARRSLTDFIRLSQPTLDITPFHHTYYHTLNLFAHGQIRRLIVSVPPQHGKSLGSSVLLPSYLLGIKPSCCIALASYNLRLASRFNRQIQRLMCDRVYRQVFPNSRLKRSAAQDPNASRTAEGFDLVGASGGLLCAGREGSLTGNPVDIFILDDLYKDAMEANSPLCRDNTWEWYNAVVRTRLHNQSQELIVFTRWHDDDLIGRIARHETVEPWTGTEPIDPDYSGWWMLNFEAIQHTPPTPVDPRPYGAPLWPARHSLQLLEQKRRLDPILFETMYQGHPTVREGLLYGDRLNTYTTLPTQTIKRANYTDTADTGNDYLCSICYEVAQDGRIYVVDALYTTLPMEQTELLVSEMLVRNRTLEARIESNNGGRGFARSVAARCPNVRIEWFHQSANKEARILSNAPAVLTRIMMPEGWNLRWDKLYGDLATFRRTVRANRHDDAPDVLTGIVETENSDLQRNNIRAVGFKQ